MTHSASSRDCLRLRFYVAEFLLRRFCYAVGVVECCRYVRQQSFAFSASIQAVVCVSHVVPMPAFMTCHLLLPNDVPVPVKVCAHSGMDAQKSVYIRA